MISNITVLKSSIIRELIKLDWSEKGVVESSSDFMTRLIDFLISNLYLHSVELGGTQQNEPWFINLSHLQTWIKMDPNAIINQFSHLYI